VHQSVDVARSEASLAGLDDEARETPLERIGDRVDLEPPSIGGLIEDLARKVREVDHVVVDDDDASSPPLELSSHAEENRTTEAAGADEEESRTFNSAAHEKYSSSEK
jgi:hypothetical protein